MKLCSILVDQRINAYNVLIEISAVEYVEIAKEIILNNELQRKKVKSSGTVYSLLKQDLKNGCLIPAISLAYKENSITGIESITPALIERILADRKNLLILDGLQRTLLLLDIASEDIEILRNLVLRIELYLGINEISILYRMLTLNTGQTPMSLRHQIEMLYSKYLDHDYSEIRLLRQIDDEAKQNINDFIFSNVIEGFNAYLERSESPIDRFSLLEIIQNMENVAKENMKVDLFKEYVDTYYNFIQKAHALSNGWVFPDDNEIIPAEYSLEASPFAKCSYKIFNRSQALTGFGSAVGRLVDQGVIREIKDINNKIDILKIHDVDSTYYKMLKNLDLIRQESKKIGNSQRVYFHHFFRGLFSDVAIENNCFDSAVDYAYRQYKLQMM